MCIETHKSYVIDSTIHRRHRQTDKQTNLFMYIECAQANASIRSSSWVLFGNIGQEQCADTAIEYKIKAIAYLFYD